MSRKVILTTEQYNMVISEGAWENVKYALSKMGRYKADGKVFGKSGVDAEYQAKIQAIIDKKGNEVIKKLNDEIKSKNPEFPNNKKGGDFLNTVMEIAAVYDSIVEATKKEQSDKTYLPEKAANDIIEDLREYVRKFLDVDLTAAYSVVDEIEGNNLELTEDEESTIDEAWGLGEVHVQYPKGYRKGEPENISNPVELNPNDTSGQPNKGNPEDISQPIELDPKDTSKGEPENISQPIELNPNDSRVANSTGQQSNSSQQSVGGQSNGGQLPNGKTKVNVSGQGTNKNRGNGGEYVDFEDIPNGQQSSGSQPNTGGSQPNTSGQSSLPRGTQNKDLDAKDVRSKLQGKNAGQNFQSKRMDSLNSNNLSMILNTLGIILGPIGITGIVTGGLTKLIRMKGLKQSRAKTLNDLYQSIGSINGNQPETPENPEGQPAQQTQGKGGTVKSSSVDSALNKDLQSLFKFLVSNRKKLGVRSNPNVGTGSALQEGRYIKDKRLVQFLQKNLSVDKLALFEDFMGRIELIRNRVKKINPKENQAMANFYQKLSTNPIMLTDFQKLFAIDSNNPKAVNALKAFIDDVFITVYSGKFKYEGLIDKMASLNEEGGAYNFVEPNKSFLNDAQNRGTFKKNLVNFLVVIISISQYLSGATRPTPKVAPKKKPQQTKNYASESVIDESQKLINEEIGRIKKIIDNVNKN